MITFKQDPDDKETYKLDWSDRLNGGTIAASTFTAETGLTVGTASFTATTTTVQLAGGTEGNEYEVTNQVTLATSGDMLTHVFRIIVRN